MRHISIIAAVDQRLAIGQDQQLLCYLPNDLKHFKAITMGHTIIMGRKTFESLPKGALPNRKNIVLTSSPTAHFDNALVYNSLWSALISCEGEEEVFIIGGANVYNQAIEIADKLYITEISHTFREADTFFPEIKASDWIERERKSFPQDENNPYAHDIVTYIKKK